MKKKINAMLITACTLIPYVLIFKRGTNLFLFLCLFLLFTTTYLIVNFQERVLTIKYLALGRVKGNDLAIIIIFPFIHVIWDLIQIINIGYDEKKNIFFAIICSFMTLLVFGVKCKDRIE